jgi:GNAT superfamily N-acetyltransferase
MPTDEPDLVLRQAGPDDALALADLYTEARVAAVPMMPPALHTNEEDRGWFSGQLAKPTHEAWSAERDGELVGYALFDDRWLDHLFIRAGWTGQGIGAALLDLVKSLRPNGFCLWVFESNTGARRFYQRHGLVELERTNGSGNEEKAPDVRMAWPGPDPIAFHQRLLDEVDGQLGDLLARRQALTRVGLSAASARADHAADVAETARALAERAPDLGRERLTRIAELIVTEIREAARD